MKSILVLLFLSMPAFAVGSHDTNPPHPSSPDDPRPTPITVAPAPPYPNDLPREGYPLAEPAYPAISYGEALPKRVPWTLNGSRFLIDYAREVCRGETYIRCESVNKNESYTNSGEWGFRIYRKDTGAYLGTIDRNIGEEVQSDYSATVIDAENRHPESKWVARMEAEKAQLEYIAAACASGAVYCTSMATKVPDNFKALFSAACSLWSGMCVAKVTTMKLDIQKKIDYVKSQCAAGDQQCFDAVTNGGETAAAWKSQYEKSGGGTGGGGGERPPHDIRPVVFGDADPMQWYDSSCEHCKIIEGKKAEEF